MSDASTRFLERNHSRLFFLVLAVFTVFSLLYGSLKLDIDEVGFSIEPYQIFGGDYTLYYAKNGDVKNVLYTAAKSYYYYWIYRPLFNPVIKEEHKKLFAREYEAIYKTVGTRVDKYRRLIVPYPDRIRHGAGKPLLPAILTMPFVGLAQLLSPSGKNHNYYQLNYNYHWIFIIIRIPAIIAGLMSIILLYRLLGRYVENKNALLGAAVFAFFPTSVKFFPNIHHDAYFVPFAIASLLYFLDSKYVKAGLLLGLAAATKNVAIFVWLGFVLYSVFTIYEIGLKKELLIKETKKQIGIHGILIVVSFVTLLPFANPISYFKEIVTPAIALIDSEAASEDKREDISKHLISERLKLRYQNEPDRAQLRPAVLLLYGLGIFNITIFAVVVAAGFAFAARQNKLTTIALSNMVLIYPFQLLFQPGLSYRYLFFSALFAMLVAVYFKKRFLIILLVIFLMADVVLLSDPITASTIHYQSNSDTIWNAMWNAVF